MAIIVTKPEKATSPLRTRINEIMFFLSKDAKQNREIQALMVARDYEVEEAYDFSYGCVNYDKTDYGCSSDPAYLAIEIIALKERYRKLIERCKVRHERFKQALSLLPSSDREVLLKAFCTQLEVDEQDVKKVIRKHLKLIESYYLDERGDKD